MCIWYSNLLCYILYLVKKLFCFVFLQKILLLYLIGYYPSREGPSLGLCRSPWSSSWIGPPERHPSAASLFSPKSSSKSPSTHHAAPHVLASRLAALAPEAFRDQLFRCFADSLWPTQWVPHALSLSPWGISISTHKPSSVSPTHTWALNKGTSFYLFLESLAPDTWRMQEPCVSCMHSFGWIPQTWDNPLVSWHHSLARWPRDNRRKFY